jgi:hypothetical protein
LPGIVLLGVERTAVDTTWQPVWGETKDIRDHYVQLTFTCGRVGRRRGDSGDRGAWGPAGR